MPLKDGQDILIKSWWPGLRAECGDNASGAEQTKYH
jgi:hypothetical protein